MKKLIIALVIIVLLIISLPFIISMFVDPNDYKGKVQQLVEEETGLKLDFQGDISLSMFPPSVKVYDLAVYNPTGRSKGPIVRNLDAVVMPKLLDLISGDVVVKKVDLKDAVVELIEYSDGVQNWHNDKTLKLVNDEEPAAGSAQAEEQGAEKSPISGEVGIKNVKFTLSDGVGNLKEQIHFKDVDVNYISAIDPIDYDAKVEYKGLDLALKGSYYKDYKKGNIKFGTTNLQYLISDHDASDNFFNFSTKSLAEIYELAGVKVAEKSVSSDELSISAKPNVVGNVVQMQDLAIKLGSYSGEGTSSYDRKKNFADVKIKFAALDLDNILKTLPKTAEQEKVVKNKRGITTNPEAFRLPVNFNLDLTADTVTYQDLEHKNFKLGANGSAKDIAIQPFSVDFNGDVPIEVFGLVIFKETGPKFEGSLISSSKNFRNTLKNLGVDLNTNDANVLNKFSLNSNIIADNKLATFSKIKAKLDETEFSGDVRYNFGTNDKISGDLVFSGANLNSYMPKKKVDAAKESTVNKGVKRRFGALDFLKSIPLDINPNVRIGRLKIGEDIYKDVRLKGLIRKEFANIENFSFNSKKISAYGQTKVEFESGNPVIKANIALGDINVDNFISEASRKQAASRPGVSKAKWSDRTLSLAPLDVIKGDIDLEVRSISQDDVKIENAKFNLNAKNGLLKMTNISGDLYEGKLKANANLDANGIPSFTINGSFFDVNINKALIAVADQANVYGLFNSSFAISGGGSNQREMVSSLAGTITVNSYNMAIRGFDLQSFVRRLNSSGSIFDIGNLLSLASDKAVTKIHDIKGNIDVEGGVVNIPSLAVNAEYASGIAQGTVDLNKWYMDVLTNFTLAIRGEKKYPTLGVGIKGDVSNPNKYFDTREIERYLSRKGSAKAVDYIQDKGLISGERAKKVQELGVEGAIQDGINKTIEKGAGKLIDKLF